MTSQAFTILLQNLFEFLKDDEAAHPSADEGPITLPPMIRALLEAKGSMAGHSVAPGLLFGGDPSAALLALAEGLVIEATTNATSAYHASVASVAQGTSITSQAPLALFSNAIRDTEGKATVACQLLFWRLGLPNPLDMMSGQPARLEHFLNRTAESSSSSSPPKTPIASTNVREASISLLWACSSIFDKDANEPATNARNDEEDDTIDANEGTVDDASNEPSVPLPIIKGFQAIALSIMCRHLLWAMAANEIRRCNGSGDISQITHKAKQNVIKAILSDILDAITKIIIPSFAAAASQSRASSRTGAEESVASMFDLLLGNDYEAPLVSNPLTTTSMATGGGVQATIAAPPTLNNHADIGLARCLWVQHIVPLASDIVWLSSSTAEGTDAAATKSVLAALGDLIANAQFALKYGSYNPNTNTVDYISLVRGRLGLKPPPAGDLSDSVLIKCLKADRLANYEVAMARYHKAIASGRQAPQPQLPPLGSNDNDSHVRMLWVAPLLTELASLMCVMANNSGSGDSLRSLLFSDMLGISASSTTGVADANPSAKASMSIEAIKAWWDDNTSDSQQLSDLIDPAYARTIPIEQRMERIHSRKDSIKAVLIVSDDEEEGEDDASRIARQWESAEDAKARALETKLMAVLYGKGADPKANGSQSLVNEIMGVKPMKALQFPPITITFLLHQILVEDSLSPTAASTSPNTLSILNKFVPLAVKAFQFSPPQAVDNGEAPTEGAATGQYVVTLSTSALVLAVLQQLLTAYHNNNSGASNKFTVDFAEEHLHEEELRAAHLGNPTAAPNPFASNGAHEVRSSQTYQAFAHLTQCLLHLTRSCPSQEHRVAAKQVLALVLDTFVLSVRRKLLSALFALAPTSAMAEAALTLIKAEATADTERIAAGFSHNNNNAAASTHISRFLTHHMAMEMINSLRLRVIKEIKLLRMMEWVDAITAATQFLRLILIQETRGAKGAPFSSYCLLASSDIKRMQDNISDGKLVVRGNVLEKAKGQTVLGGGKKESTGKATAIEESTAEYVAACMLEWVLRPLQEHLQKLEGDNPNNNNDAAVQLNAQGSQSLAPSSVFGFECAYEGFSNVLHFT